MGLVLLGTFILSVTERVAYRGDVLPGVEVPGVDIAGESELAAYGDLSDLAARLTSEPIRARAGETELHADPSALGLEVDSAVTLRAARQAGRSRNPIDQTLGTVLRRFRPDRVPLVLSYDPDRVDEVVERWYEESLDEVDNGGLAFQGIEVSVVEPRAGSGIDRDEARSELARELDAAERIGIELTVGAVEPDVTAADLERLAARARELLGGDIEIVTDEATITLTPDGLATALDTRLGDAGAELTVDTERLSAALGDRLLELVRPPIDATFRVVGSRVEVVPSVPGRSPDLEAVAEKILRGERRIVAPREDIAPARDTAWAESLGIEVLVSSFTTRYPAGQSRVTNIHRAADLLDGTILAPGEVFSFNGTVGARTEARGFVAAPVFYNEFTEDVGGGVSQVATAVFNAAFFGSYAIVTHRPHSIYFDRYPMGREATVNYPDLDLQFRNDSGAGVLMKASYTATSLTISLYGDIGDTTVRATEPNVLAERPPERTYVDDPSRPAGEEVRLEAGRTGYDVEVFRIIERPDRDPIRQRFFWRYRMLPEQWVRGTAPPTTTTTEPEPEPEPPPTTTTTAPPATTTTVPEDGG